MLDVFDLLDVVHPVDVSQFIHTLKFDIRVHRKSCFQQLHLRLFVSKLGETAPRLQYVG